MARSARASSVVDRSLLGLCLLTSSIALFLPGELRDPLAATVRRSIAAPLAELQSWAQLRRAAFMTYEERTGERARVAQTETQLRAVSAENARLRAMLGLAGRLDWGFVTAEAIPNQLASKLISEQILQTFMVTAGSRAGVEPFTPVVAPEGLVGMVRQVDAGMSQAISYLHQDFRVSAMTPDASAFGIVQAHLGEGSARGLLEMRGVPFRSPLRAGQLVVSSGLGGTYPAGVAVGTVVREIQTAEKWARTYLLQPSVPLANIGAVFLLSKRRSNAGVQTVWTSVPAADSAARATAAAGDSVAQAAALRETAARRAALDSVLRDSLGTTSTPARPAVVPPPTPATVPRPDSAAARPATPVPPGQRRPATDTSARPRPDSARRPIRPTVPIPTGGTL